MADKKQQPDITRSARAGAGAELPDAHGHAFVEPVGAPTEARPSPEGEGSGGAVAGQAVVPVDLGSDDEAFEAPGELDVEGHWSRV